MEFYYGAAHIISILPPDCEVHKKLYCTLDLRFGIEFIMILNVVLALKYFVANLGSNY